MKTGFDIQYLIGQKEKEELSMLKNINQYSCEARPDGWILINIGEYEYGFLQNDSSLDGFELLDIWFKSFKEIYINLHSLGKAVLDYWEEPSDCFIFERKDDNICIKYIEKEVLLKKGQVIETNEQSGKLIAETFVHKDAFFFIIKSKVNEFWNDIGNLNPILKDYVEQFKI